MLHRVHLGRAALIGVLLGLAAPTAALADGVPSMTVGPIQVNHGYTVTAFGFSCDTQYAGGEIVFSKLGRGWTETHTYQGFDTGASCHMSKDLSSGSLKFSIGNEAMVNISFSKRGSKKRGALPPGCTGTHPMVQGGIAKGTFKSKIDSAFFGKVSKRRIKASMESTPSFTCPPSKSFKKTYLLDVSSGSEASSKSLTALLPPHGKATLSLFENKSSSTMFESHVLTLTASRSVFTAKSDLSSAKVTGTGKFKGHLTFKADPSCHGNSRTGTISGRLTAHMDVIGPQTIKPTTPPPSANLSRNATGAPCT